MSNTLLPGSAAAAAALLSPAGADVRGAVAEAAGADACRPAAHCSALAASLAPVWQAQHVCLLRPG